MTCQIPHRIRPMGLKDHGFVRDAWLRSGCDAPGARWVPHALYLRLQADRVERWLSQHGKETHVACAEGEDDVLLGFICSPAPAVVFYLYVKHDLRRLGLARALWQFSNPALTPVLVTHWGESCPSIATKHPGLMVYDPSRLEDPRRRHQGNRPRKQPAPQVFTTPPRQSHP